MQLSAQPNSGSSSCNFPLGGRGSANNTMGEDYSQMLAVPGSISVRQDQF